MANRRFIDFPIASTSGDTDIILIWQDGLNKQTTKATFLSGLPENLDELNDVAISSLTNGQILQYNSVTGKWENVDRTDIDLDELGDVTIVSPSNGQVLIYNSSTSKWENSSIIGGFVPYTGATADVNLGTHDLAAERGTFANNGSSDTLTVNHTSGSGYGIIVTKGGNNEALYVNKTSGSGNAMRVLGGRTSLVDLSLSSVSNATGNFLTISSNVVHQRTAAQVLTDIGGQAALTNPVTGTGTSGQVAYFNGTTTITSESSLFWDATNDRLGIGTSSPTVKLNVSNAANGNIALFTNTADADLFVNLTSGVTLLTPSTGTLAFGTLNTERVRLNLNGNLLVGTTLDNGSKLQVNGSFSAPHVTKSANYTLDATDYTVGFDCASNRTATLPDATTCQGRIYVIYQYNTGSGARSVTLDGNGSQTINGVTTYSLSPFCEYTSVMIQSNGANWIIISSNFTTDCL
jgi:hypothetical protein